MERQSERDLVPLQLWSGAPNAHANKHVQANLNVGRALKLFSSKSSKSSTSLCKVESFRWVNLSDHPELQQIHIIIPEQKTPRNFKIWTFLQVNNLWPPVKNVNTWPVFQNLCRLLSDWPEKQCWVPMPAAQPSKPRLKFFSPTFL